MTSPDQIAELLGRVGLSVKPLVWTQSPPPAFEHEPFVYWAAGIGGHYRAERDGLLWMAHDGFIWEQHASQEAAKAAAQSDYEQRILAGLSSPGRGGEVG